MPITVKLVKINFIKRSQPNNPFLGASIQEFVNCADKKRPYHKHIQRRLVWYRWHPLWRLSGLSSQLPEPFADNRSHLAFQVFRTRQKNMICKLATGSTYRKMTFRSGVSKQTFINVLRPLYFYLRKNITCLEVLKGPQVPVGVNYSVLHCESSTLRGCKNNNNKIKTASHGA